MASADARSGGALERVVIDGERHVVKHLHVDHYTSALASKGIDLGDNDELGGGSNERTWLVPTSSDPVA